MISKTIKILHLEDTPTDAELVELELKKGDILFEKLIVDNQKDYVTALRQFAPDIVLSDHSLPEFNSMDALKILKETGSTIPFILITSTVSEEFAVNIMREGAADYMLKDRMQRLPGAVINAIEKFNLETEQLKYLKELIINEAFLTEAENIARIGSIEVELRSQVTKWSPGFYRILGYRTDEVKPSIQSFINSIYNDDLEKVQREIDFAIANRGSAFLNFRIAAKNGGIAYINGKIIIHSDRNNNAAYLKGFVQDITERTISEKSLNLVNQELKIQTSIKESEARFRLALEKIGDNVWEHNFKTNKTAFSNSDKEFFGYSTAELASNPTLLLNIVHRQDIHLLEENDSKYKKGLIDSHKMEYRIVHKNGTVKWVMDRGVAIEKDENGISERIIGTHTDISQQKKLELDLIDARQKAEQLAKTKELFLANMSHEIRTPMNAILGMSNQLAKTNLQAEQKFYLNTIHAAADNLLGVINDILDMSKIEAGKINIENVGFELRSVVKRAIQVLTLSADEKHLRLSNSFFDDRIAPVLIGDPHRISQVLINLINNAIKFTEMGTVDIKLKLLQDAATWQKLEIEVNDTGMGIEASFIKHLFDKFSQENETIARKYGGTGLGMSICKELVGLMGGEISAVSQKGLGTSILFTIMLKKADHTSLPGDIAVSFDAMFLSGKKIMVADDHEMNRLLASIILQNYGAEIVEAANGQQVIDETLKQKPDIILMDLQMPVLNGFEATLKLREYSITIPIIALTANAIKGEREKCLAAGMNDYISKPFIEKDFLEIIKKWSDVKATPKKDEPIKPYGPDMPIYDLSALKVLSRGNNAFVEKMVRIFCEQTPAMVNDMKAAYERADYEKLKAIAHKIKPSIESLKIERLKQLISEIEKSGKFKTNHLELPQQLKLLDKIITEAVTALNIEYPIF